MISASVETVRCTVLRPGPGLGGDVWTTDQLHTSCLHLSHDEPPGGTRSRLRGNQTGGWGTATTGFRGSYVAAVCRCSVARDIEVASGVTTRCVYPTI